MRTVVAFLAGLLVFNLLVVLTLTRCAAQVAAATVVVDAPVEVVWSQVGPWVAAGGGEPHEAVEGGGDARVELGEGPLWLAVQSEHDGRSLILLRAAEETPLRSAIGELRGLLGEFDSELEVFWSLGQGE